MGDFREELNRLADQISVYADDDTDASRLGRLALHWEAQIRILSARTGSQPRCLRDEAPKPAGEAKSLRCPVQHCGISYERMPKDGRCHACGASVAPTEPAPSAPGDGCGACGDACNGGPCRLAQESPPTAPADVEALADEIGTESRKSGGVRLWEFSAVELREFARRLSGAQQADPVEELPAIATDIPAPVEG